MRAGLVLAVLVGALALAASATAQIMGPPRNDLLALGQGEGDTPDPVTIQKPPAPPIKATPAATRCAPGAKPQPSIDGRVPAGSADNGLWCNMTMVSHQGTS